MSEFTGDNADWLQRYACAKRHMRVSPLLVLSHHVRTEWRQSPISQGPETEAAPSPANSRIDGSAAGTSGRENLDTRRVAQDG
jgi:hypothetical protein